ncbi:MAG: hypothetical protein ACRYG6_08210 [Janthinobacterium lividum]
MYLWLFIVVFVLWAWLTGGSFVAWKRKGLNRFLALGSVGVWTGAAALAILFIGPYWRVVYSVFGQPG